MKVPKLKQRFNVIMPQKGELRRVLSNDELDFYETRIKKEGPEKWYARSEVIPGSGLYTGAGQLEFDNENFFPNHGISNDSLKGKRVLDIGCFAGTMSFAAENFGANVVGIDVISPYSTGYSLLHEIRNSSSMHVQCSVYDLNPELFGFFDLVIFSGVHYHLKHPILALERINSVLKHHGQLLTIGTVCDYWMPTIEDGESGLVLSEIKDSVANSNVDINRIPLGVFYSSTYLKDSSNWFVPSTEMLEQWLKSTGFKVQQRSTSKMEFRKDLFAGLSGSGGIGVAYFLSEKISHPVDEYEVSVYPHLRSNFGGRKSDAYRFQITPNPMQARNLFISRIGSNLVESLKRVMSRHSKFD